MAERPGDRQGQPLDADGQGGGRRGAVDTGLSALAPDPQGSDRRADLRVERGVVEALAPLPDDAGGQRAERDRRQPHQDADAGDGGRLRRSDDGSRRHGEGCSADLLPQAGQTGGAEQRAMAVGHRQAANQATADVAEARLRDGDGILAGKLIEGAGLALDHSIDVLKMELPARREKEAFAAILTSKDRASQTILTLVARSNENKLKRQAVDKMSELIRLIQAEEERRMKLIER